MNKAKFLLSLGFYFISEQMQVINELYKIHSILSGAVEETKEGRDDREYMKSAI